MVINKPFLNNCRALCLRNMLDLKFELNTLGCTNLGVVCSICFFVDRSVKKSVDKIERKSAKEVNACQTCSYSTVYKANLQRHIRLRHTKEKPHQCRFCTYKSGDQSAVKKHMKSH